MREVAVIAFAQTPNVRHDDRNEVEMLMPVIDEVIGKSGIKRQEIGFTCSGSCDYLAGQPFAFVMALDAVGAWPPINESHVEMDGAWALYEAWVKIQTGQVESALVYSFGKSSMGDLPDVINMQLDPYYLQPTGVDSISLAALQARAWLDAGKGSERDMAEVAVRSRKAALANPNAHQAGEYEVDKLLAEPTLVSPLRKHDCPPITDGAAAVVIAAGDLARRVCTNPAWIKGIDHRSEAHQYGMRDLTDSPSTRIAAEKLGLAGRPVDVAELHAPFTHQELILREALGLGDDVEINPSGGALGANAMMVAGLIRIGEAAERIRSGSAQRAVAHATSGSCLQQNLVCVLEGE